MLYSQVEEINSLAGAAVSLRVKPRSTAPITNPEKANYCGFNIAVAEYPARLRVSCIGTAKTIGLEFQLDREVCGPVEAQLILHMMAKFMRNHKVWPVFSDL